MSQGTENEQSQQLLQRNVERDITVVKGDNSVAFTPQVTINTVRYSIQANPWAASSDVNLKEAATAVLQKCILNAPLY